MSFDGEKLGRALANLKRSWAKGVCLHPDAPTSCTGKPIDSHTLQRSRALTNIATDGHVLRISLDPAAILKLGLSAESLGHPLLDVLTAQKNVGKLEPETIGIGNASVFPGFCGGHDNSTFAPIEEVELTFDDLQFFLFTYRPACMELWAKRCKIKVTERTIADEGSTEFLELVSKVDDLALSEHLERKVRQDAILLSGDHSGLHGIVFELDSNPGIATSGVFSPEVDFGDNPIQYIADFETPLQHVSYSVIPGDGTGHVVIGWDGECPANEQFVESLLNLGEDEWPDALVRVPFESIENTFFSEVWWASLTDTEKLWASLRTYTGGLGFRPISYKPDEIGIAKFKASVLRRF